MEYPPPPYNVFLAYSFGKISTNEALHLLKLWKEKHAYNEYERRAKDATETWRVYQLDHKLDD